MSELETPSATPGLPGDHLKPTSTMLAWLDRGAWIWRQMAASIRFLPVDSLAATCPRVVAPASQSRFTVNGGRRISFWAVRAVSICG